MKLDLKESRESFFQTGRGGGVIPCTGVEDGEGAANQQWIVWYEESEGLKAESIRSRAEGRKWCITLKTVTKIRQSRACDNTFIAESIYLFLCSLWDWEPQERLKRMTARTKQQQRATWSIQLRQDPGCGALRLAALWDRKQGRLKHVTAHTKQQR